MAARIVDQMIRRLKAPEANHHTEWDSEMPGFGVRITAAGVISFILDYRIHGRHRRYTIGRYPDEYGATAARTGAGELRQRIREGRDPMEERNRAVMSQRSGIWSRNTLRAKLSSRNGLARFARTSGWRSSFDRSSAHIG